MEVIGSTTNMTIRIDKNFKKETDNLFKKLGINTTSAIMMFLKQCHREQGLPFSPSLTPAPSKELQESLLEAEEMRQKINRKGYDNIDDLMKALDD